MATSPTAVKITVSDSKGQAQGPIQLNEHGNPEIQAPSAGSVSPMGGVQTSSTSALALPQGVVTTTSTSTEESDRGQPETREALSSMNSVPGSIVRGNQILSSGTTWGSGGLESVIRGGGGGDEGDAIDRSFRNRVWNLMEDSSSSTAALWMSRVIFMLVVISMFVFALETFTWALEDPWPAIFVPIDLTIVALFTVEYLVRLWAAPDRFAWMKTPAALIDFFAVAPFYVEAILDGAGVSSPLNSRAGLALRMLRVGRVLRVFKATRGVTGFSMLSEAMKRSASGLSVVLAGTTVAVLVFSSMIYFAELEGSYLDTSTGIWLEGGPDGASTGFQSIPGSVYWTITTMTTVGYGDRVPKTATGRFVGALTMIAGVLTIGFPITIIGSHFLDIWKDEQRLAEAQALGTVSLLQQATPRSQRSATAAAIATDQMEGEAGQASPGQPNGAGGLATSLPVPTHNGQGTHRSSTDSENGLRRRSWTSVSSDREPGFDTPRRDGLVPPLPIGSLSSRSGSMSRMRSASPRTGSLASYKGLSSSSSSDLRKLSVDNTGTKAEGLGGRRGMAHQLAEEMRFSLRQQHLEFAELRMLVDRAMARYEFKVREMHAKLAMMIALVDDVDDGGLSPATSPSGGPSTPDRQGGGGSRED